MSSPAELIRRASRILSDQESGAAYTGWSVNDLLDYYNEAMSTVFQLRPTAFSKLRTIHLRPGARQELPPEYGALVSLDSNTSPDCGDGSSITQSALDMVSAMKGKATCTRSGNCTKYEVSSWRHLKGAEYLFAVEPPVPCGADVEVEATVTVRPVPVTFPQINEPTALPSEFDAMIVDWICYRAYSEDAESQHAYMAARRHQAAFYDGVNGGYLVASRQRSGYILGEEGTGHPQMWRGELRTVGR